MQSLNPAAIRVMVAGLCSLILTMGVARFAYTPLLPEMTGATLLNDEGAGWLASINYIGYLLGTLIATRISSLPLKDRLYRAGLLLAVITTIGMALAESFWLWALMRLLAGLCSAAGLLLGSGLIMNWLIRHQYRAELGIHFAGIGGGIAVTAVVVWMMAGHLDWAGQWVGLSALGLLLLWPAWRWLPRPDTEAVRHAGSVIAPARPSAGWMRLLNLFYFCAGFGYAVMATFLVQIVERQPALAGQGHMVWLLVGLAGMPACVIWDRLARRITELPTMGLLFVLHIVAILLPLISMSVPSLWLAAILFGCTFVGIVSLMLTMVGRYFPDKPAVPMARLTLSFGVAQIIAPALSGSLAERLGDYRLSLLISAAVMLAGLMLLLWLQLTRARSLQPAS